ncbi:UBP19 hydrolase, partial [Polypterus senegalus]
MSSSTDTGGRRRPVSCKLEDNSNKKKQKDKANQESKEAKQETNRDPKKDPFIGWKQNASEIIVKLRPGERCVKVEDVNTSFTDQSCLVKFAGYVAKVCKCQKKIAVIGYRNCQKLDYSLDVFNAPDVEENVFLSIDEIEEIVERKKSKESDPVLLGSDEAINASKLEHLLSEENSAEQPEMESKKGKVDRGSKRTIKQKPAGKSETGSKVLTLKTPGSTELQVEPSGKRVICPKDQDCNSRREPLTENVESTKTKDISDALNQSGKTKVKIESTENSEAKQEKDTSKSTTTIKHKTELINEVKERPVPSSHDASLQGASSDAIPPPRSDVFTTRDTSLPLPVDIDMVAFNSVRRQVVKDLNFKNSCLEEECAVGGAKVAVPTGPASLEKSSPGSSQHTLPSKEEPRTGEKEKTRAEEGSLDSVSARTLTEHVPLKQEPALVTSAIVASKASQFTGYAQHDAQEFMAFLLDGLHEDLNRIQSKPYTETVDSDGRPDEVVAEEAWRRHKMRNDSFIVDLFQGQYKSKLVCPICAKVSITFDPFLYLPVPLPQKQKFLVSVSKENSCTTDILESISRSVKVKPENLRLTEASESRFHRVFLPSNSLDAVSPTDTLFCFEVQSKELAKEKVVILQVQQRTQVPNCPINKCAACQKIPHSEDEKIKRCTRCYRVGYCNQYSVNVFQPPFQSGRMSPEMSQCRMEQPRLHAVVSESHNKESYLPTDEINERGKFNCVDSNIDSMAAGDCKKNAISVSTLTLDSGYSDSISELQDHLEHEKEITCEKTLKPEAVVTGYQQPTDIGANGASQFYICLIDASNKEQKLEDKGDKALDIPEGSSVILVWKNNERQKEYVLVKPKELEYIEDLGSASENARAGHFTLEQCLKLFTKPEVLAPEEAWYCPKCKQHREASKQLMLWRLPNVLIIQLKRFSFRNFIWRDKINDMVDFPVRNLDLSKFCIGQKDDSQPPIYDLYAVINHYGGMIGGHYTAYARLPSDKNSQRSDVGWRLFDDSTVTTVEESQVVTRYAYVLFYRRRNSPVERPIRRHSPHGTESPSMAAGAAASQLRPLPPDFGSSNGVSWPLFLAHPDVLPDDRLAALPDVVEVLPLHPEALQTYLVPVPAALPGVAEMLRSMVQELPSCVSVALMVCREAALLRPGRWEWLSDLPSLLPPCPGAVSYYYQFGRVPAFTESADGVRFRRILEYHLSLLEWHGEEDKVLAVSAEDGKVYHWILPAFFHLLQALSLQHREFAILFRTFGTDLPRVLVSMQKVLKEGGHPLFCDIQASHISLTLTPGRIRCGKNNVKLTRGDDKIISRGDDRRLYQYFSSLQGIGGFQDHFDWWVRNSFSSLGGKPVWIDPYDPDVQHIFIDDNIRLNDEDTIVNPKVFIDKESHQTRTAPTSEFYNVNLVQTDLLMAISNQNYFIDCIRACEENYEKYLQESDN